MVVGKDVEIREIQRQEVQGQGRRSRNQTDVKNVTEGMKEFVEIVMVVEKDVNLVSGDILRCEGRLVEENQRRQERGSVGDDCWMLKRALGAKGHKVYLEERVSL